MAERSPQALNFVHTSQAGEELLKDRSRNNRPKMESLVLSPKSANQDLIIVSASLRNGIFIHSFFFFYL